MTELSSLEDKAAITQLVEVLRPHAMLSWEQLKALLTSGPDVKKTPRKASAKPPKETLDRAAVEGYVAALNTASSDGARVRMVISELKCDKRIKAGEVSAILSQVRGSEVKVTRKTDGLKEIERWFQRKRETDRRISGAGDIY